jgi:hypothetical protein
MTSAKRALWNNFENAVEPLTYLHKAIGDLSIKLT